MSAAALICRLARCDVTLRSDGDKLIIDGPGELVTDALVQEIRAVKAEILAELTKGDAADLRYLYDERAAVCQFDGGLDRAKAEAQAFEAAIIRWLNSNPAPSDPAAGCLSCGKPEMSANALLAFDARGNGYAAWLHGDCWAAWYAGRRAEAATALAAIGIPTPPGNGCHNG